MESFAEYFKEQELIEMARRKRKMHTPIAKKDDEPMVIKGEIGRAGHMTHQTGGGVHTDKRKRRLNTRASQQKKAIDDQS